VHLRCGYIVYKYVEVLCCNQGHNDGGYIGIYTPKISLPYKFSVVTGCFFLFDPTQIVVDFEIGMSSSNLYPPMKLLATPLAVTPVKLAIFVLT